MNDQEPEMERADLFHVLAILIFVSGGVAALIAKILIEGIWRAL